MEKETWLFPQVLNRDKWQYLQLSKVLEDYDISI